MAEASDSISLVFLVSLRLTVGSEVAVRDIVQFVPFRDFLHVSRQQCILSNF